jgi:Phage gp6-like head-tail connector protein
VGYSDVTVDELARAVNVGAGPSNEARLQAAIDAAESTIGAYTGRTGALPDDWPMPFPAGPHGAILQLAVRMYRSGDVAFGVLQTDLGATFTGRWLTPELDAQLIGWRLSFGVA